MKALYLFVFGLFFLQSCSLFNLAANEDASTEVMEEKPTEKEAEKSEEVMSFIIGEGGGFTGKYILYRLSSNGKTELYDEQNDTYQDIGNVPKAKAEAIFDELSELNLVDYEFYRPGNMNYRITVSGEGRTNSITWSDNRSPDDEVLFFYKKVMNEIRSLN
jgi:hypothetical protein